MQSQTITTMSQDPATRVEPVASTAEPHYRETLPAPVLIGTVEPELAGVFTDGDLRRHLAKDDGVLDQPLTKVMTRRPTTIREDALAADAIRIFNERSIDDLIVVNTRREPVGLVDSQDLPKLKAV